MGDEDGDDGDSPQQHPLAGVVMCCTSIAPEQRTALSSAATVMGAVHKLDLTADVTHLLVGSWDTPKYRYVARERPDVRCLRPSFVDAAHAAWIEGRDDELLDLPTLEATHRWPTFGGVRVCITGFQDPALRREIERVIVEGGGQYKGDLTRDITHLIAHEPKGAKYVHAKHWGVKCVALEWLRDTVERGMVLDEAYYDPSLDPQDRGVGSWVRRRRDSKVDAGADGADGTGNAETVTAGTKRKQPPTVAAADKPARKLRRTASARFSSQNENIWGDIVGGGGFGATKPRQDAWEENDTGRATNPSHSESVTTQESGLHRSASAPSIRAAASTSRSFFEDKVFYIHGFDRKQTSVLQRHLTSLKVHILPDETAFIDATNTSSDGLVYLLVPHDLSLTSLPYAKSSYSRLVTEFWLEKCLHAKQFLEPGSIPIYEPFVGKIPGFEKLTVSSTGFADIDLLHVGKAVRELGATYEGTLSRKVSVLLCNDTASRATEKLSYARNHQIPTVKPSWLWACMRDRSVVSMSEYLLFDTEEGPKKNAVKRRESNARENKSKQPLRKQSPSPVVDMAPDSRRASVDLEAQPPHLETAATTFDVADSFVIPADDSVGGNTRLNRAVNTALQITTPHLQATTTGGPYAHSLQRALQERSPNASPTKGVVAESFATTTSSIARGGIADTHANMDAAHENAIDATTKHPANARALESALADVLAARRLRSRRDTDPRPGPVGSAGDAFASELYAVAAVAGDAEDSSVLVGSGAAGARRRKKQLFGRAASNLSAGSARAGGRLSRTASIASVGSANTDGVGTPLGIGSAGVSPAKMRVFGAKAALARAAADDGRPRSGVGELFDGAAGSLAEAEQVIHPLASSPLPELTPEAPPGPATQVSYEDPDARAWQRQLAAKQGWELGDEAAEQSSDERRLKHAGWDEDESDDDVARSVGRARAAKKVYGGRKGLRGPK